MARTKSKVEHYGAQESSLEDKWQNKLYRARQLRKDGTKALFERCQLLVEVYQDEQYQAECQAQGIVVEDELDKEVADFCTSFLLVKEVYEANPEVEAWLQHGFLYLAHELAASQPKEARAGTSYKKLYEELKRKDEASQREIARLRELYEHSQQEIERLRSELTTVHESLRILGKQAPARKRARKSA